MSYTNHVKTWYDILRSVMRLPPDTRNNVFGFIDRVVELYLQSPPNEQNESKDELDDALAAMEASMQQSITKQAGSSRKRVRKQFKKSKTKYTTRHHK